jgi:uncharacterized membrane protein (UPF0182 family)
MTFFESSGREGWEDLGPPPPPFRIARRPTRRFGSLTRWLALFAGIILLFIVANVAVSIYADWLWFESVSFRSVYAKILVTRVWLFFAAAAVFLAFFLGNVLLTRRLAPPPALQPIVDVEPAALRRITMVVLLTFALFLAVIFGSIASGRWETFLLYLNGEPFGVEDPVFHRDVGFYVFSLPALQFMQGWSLGVAILTTIVVAGIYAFRISLHGFAFNITTGVKAHLSILVALILGLFIWRYWLGIYELNFSTRGPVFGATFTDLHAQLPVTYALIALAALAIVVILINIFRRGVLLPVGVIGLWVVAAIVGGLIYPATVQRFDVDPNELTKERPYIERNIEFTRSAYALDRIDEQEFPAELQVSQRDIESNPQTIQNVRLWDSRPMRDTFNQVQALRQLYEFSDVDVDRYFIDGEYRQVMLSARELNSDRLPPEADGWVNRRLQFTHGYGLVLAPVNEVVEEGLPDLQVKDIPPQGFLEVDRPEIYFGELTDEYVIVKTKELEFDYPPDNRTTFEGSGGIRLNSFWRRLTYAWKFADPNIMISQQISGDSSLLYRRDIPDRIHTIAPFLRLDADPYLVVADGQLFWIQDAYTTTDRYPYSQPFQGQLNYIRNSVKAVVNAYSGEVTLYVAEPDDPIIRTYDKIFPDLLTPIDEMPPSLREHIRYPEDLFSVQAEMYRTYHMKEAQVFYNKEDLWTIPNELFFEKQQPLLPYYIIMRLPGEPQEEFVLMLPFTPRNRDNTNAWLAARSDGDNYGKLIAFSFPKDRLVFGPAQIEARINQDSSIAEQFTLWSRSGSTILRGNLLMIPIGQSNLYVEPIFLQSETSQLPELRRVIVANGNDISMEPTLKDALAVVLGRQEPTAPLVELPPEGEGEPLPGVTPETEATPVPDILTTPSATSTPSPVLTPTPAAPLTPPAEISDIAALVQQAQETFDRAQEALQRSDFAAYGAELEQLDEILRRLGELTSEQ